MGTDGSLSHILNREVCGALLLRLVAIQGITGDSFSLGVTNIGGRYCQNSSHRCLQRDMCIEFNA